MSGKLNVFQTEKKNLVMLQKDFITD